MSEYAKNDIYARAFKFIMQEVEWESTEIDLSSFICTVVDFVEFYIKEEEEASKR